ncbi:MAG: hypothetical protein K0R54_212 [Clostridiaceae bacterium]|jgi:hypothetical protein|nr:hypothetical protein [Clostridiaceae bacterium]
MYKEIDLFLNGIKPAILFQNIGRKEEVKKSIIDKFSSMGFYVKEIGDSLLVVRDMKQLEEKRLGVILGYYPKAVDAFMSGKRRDSKTGKSVLINYCGIQFNTYDYFEESLAWCNEAYGEKIKKIFGKISVDKMTSYLKEDGKVDFNIEEIV